MEIRKDQYYLSTFNDFPEVKQNVSFPKHLTLSDCTLRDGEQQAGVVFTKEDKIEIAEYLDAMHIPEIEAGMPCNSVDDAEAIREISKRCKNSKITCVIRGMEKDIDLAADIGAYGVTFSLPIGTLQRQYKLKWDDETYISTMCSLSEYAKKKGLYVCLSPYDTTRSDPDWMDRVMHEVVKCGAIDRVRLVDTVGAASPEAIRYMAQRIKGILGEKVWLEVHCHNDFGLAVASTIAGAMGGADVVSTTINGLGERSGNTATEETLMALRLLYGVDLGVDLTKLVGASKLVERLSNAPLQKHKAVVGKHSFSHESGMVVAGVLQCPFVAEAYAPELVGATREILIGKKSGAKSVEAKLAQRNIVLPEESVRALTEDVKNKAISLKRSLEDEEFFELAKKYQ